MHPKLKEIYDALPHVMCKGLCHTTCGPVPAAKAERAEIAALSGHRVKTSGPAPDGIPMEILRTHKITCVYLVKQRCSVYAARPLICRVYGVAEGLPCKYGCVPDGVVPDLRVLEMIDVIGRLGVRQQKGTKGTT